MPPYSGGILCVFTSVLSRDLKLPQLIVVPRWWSGLSVAGVPFLDLSAQEQEEGVLSGSAVSKQPVIFVKLVGQE